MQLPLIPPTRQQHHTVSFPAETADEVWSRVADLALDAFQFIRITLLPWVVVLSGSDQLRVLLRARSDGCSVWNRMADSARFKLDLWLHDLTCHLVDRFIDSKHSKSLCYRDEERVVCNPSAWTDTASVTENEVAWIGFRLVVRGVQVSLGTESHGVWVDCRVVGEPPADLVLRRQSDELGKLTNCLAAARHL